MCQLSKADNYTAVREGMLKCDFIKTV